MLATRWQPRNVWSEVNRMRDEMDRVFGGNGNNRFGTSVYPPLNLWEDDDQLFVEAELPGFELSELEITVTGANQLSLKGIRKQPKQAETQEGTWYRRERDYGSFSRIIELPDDVAADSVSAAFKHGVLTITLPKKEDTKPRRIDVKSA